MNKCIKDITSITQNESQMSWFVVSLFIAGLWKYDRCLLDKFQRYVWGTTKWIGWSLFKSWVQYNDKNEMIKDGYHVDSVFLVEHHSPTYSRKLDVLRIFRSEIVNETITNKTSMDMSDFLNVCSDSGSNFQFHDKFQYDLEVNYTLDRRQYKIVYSTNENNKIRFPVYSESEIAQASVENSIISASIVRRDVPCENDGIDIGDVILKYAGPLGNFYDDSEYKVKRSWLAFSDIDEQAKIKIMDIEGSEYIFKEEDEYLTLKTMN